jgi:dihydroxyacetone kinase-like protein
VSQDDVAAWLRAFAAAVAENRELLTQLDAAIGDADHGINMDRGMQAVLGKLDALDESGGTAVDPGGAVGAATTGDVGALLKSVGMTLVSTVGGAAGPLYGTLFLDMGKSAAGAPQLTVERLAAAFAAGVTGVQARGKAELGDKTMLDALVPAATALSDAATSGRTPADALRAAAGAAEQGMKATIPLVARKGRASYLGERSAGHQDPGATSSWLLLRAAAEALAADAPASRPEP